ncbi:MAG: hypothetical protein IMX02_04720 [Limnochordaceae bacterium]|nr:hypothetical protein [Limnochordaceae bacterium]
MMVSDVYYTVLPVSLEAPAGDGSPFAGQRHEVLIGHWGGVPVWVELLHHADGRWRVQRLITTAAELYLWPSLFPGTPW